MSQALILLISYLNLLSRSILTEMLFSEELHKFPRPVIHSVLGNCVLRFQQFLTFDQVNLRPGGVALPPSDYI